MAQLHLLLLGQTLVQFSTFTWWLPTIDNSSFRRLSTLFWPPGIPGTHAMHLLTCRRNMHIKKKKKRSGNTSRTKISSFGRECWSLEQVAPSPL